MHILGIETSCDETAAAIVSADRTILSNMVLSQIEEHGPFGGVVPEIAARAHLHLLPPLIKKALEEAEMNFGDLDGVAATCGPGLIGGVMIGMVTAKAIAAAHKLPFLAINHLEGHALTPRLTDDIDFPYLLLLISGGHTQILAVEGPGRYKRWGTTLDDAAGECFDKCAKIMGLPYPGGPEIDKIAAACADPERAMETYPLPRPMAGRPDLDFSFSGLKTAVKTHIDRMPPGPLKAGDVADLACAFQHSVAAIFEDRCQRAITKFMAQYNPETPAFVVSGGVAANTEIRRRLKDLCTRENFAFHAPPPGLCADNAAMIAWAGIERLQSGARDPLNFKARPRWPLDPDASPRQGAGVKA